MTLNTPVAATDDAVADLVRRLHAEVSPERREEILVKGWDTAVKLLYEEVAKSGEHGDYQRLIFESWILDGKDELLAESAATVTSLRAEIERLTREAGAWEAQLTHAERDLEFANKCVDGQKARADKAEARVHELEEGLGNAASLLEVIAEDAKKAGDIATWSMADVMARNSRSLGEKPSRILLEPKT